jgi:hypothetical protein
MITHFASFGAGFVTGWTARSVFGSTREVMVRALAFAIGARHRVRRAAAEQVEWWEDVLAEGQARYAAVVRSARPSSPEKAPPAPPTALRADRGGKAA